MWGCGGAQEALLVVPTVRAKGGDLVLSTPRQPGPSVSEARDPSRVFLGQLPFLWEIGQENSSSNTSSSRAWYPHPRPQSQSLWSGPSGVPPAELGCYRSQREAGVRGQGGSQWGSLEGALEIGPHHSAHQGETRPTGGKGFGTQGPVLSPSQYSHAVDPEGAPSWLGSSPVTCTLRFSIGHSELRSPQGPQSRPDYQHYPLQVSRPPGPSPAWLMQAQHLPSLLWAADLKHTQD